MNFYEWFEQENGITLTDEQRSLLEGSMLKARYELSVALKATTDNISECLKASPAGRFIYSIVWRLGKVG